jgi:prepilin-type processing-associated H-X9-DG protein
VAGEAVKKRGMTFFELLVILVLIGLVVALIVPVVRRAREQKRRALCTSNLQQLGMWIAYYHCDHMIDDSVAAMPPMTSVVALATNLGPYINFSYGMFACPADGRLSHAPGFSNITASSYAWTLEVPWQATTNAPLLFDKMRPSGLNVLTGSNSWSPQSAHKDGGNVLWTDGHVDWNKSLDVGTNRYPLAND